jgi:tetratricopeptide (TPR) repeat protein
MSCRIVIKHVLPLLFLLWGLAACSRPAKVIQPQARISADATLRLAQNLELKQRWQDSVQSYDSAVRQYQAFGEVRGQIYALAGLARIAYFEADAENFAKLRNRMIYLIETVDPSSKSILDLLDIYVLESEGRYAEIISLAEDSYEYPIQIRMQMLSHRLQAESYLNPGYVSTSYSDLQRLANRYRGVLKRDFSADPSVLATAEYAMSYHSFIQSNFSDAMRHAERAIDLDYRYENFSGLASGYWLKGRIHEALAETQAAIANYVKAQDIFLHIQNPQMQKAVDKALTRLQGDRP